MRAEAAFENPWMSSTLPRSADVCYQLFCDVERIAEWLPVIRSSVVIHRDAISRPRVVSYLARLDHATVGYTLQYRYNRRERSVIWETAKDTQIKIAGFAQFAPLGDRACLMSYALDVTLPDGLVPDPTFDTHAASATVNDFRDFVLRIA